MISSLKTAIQFEAISLLPKIGLAQAFVSSGFILRLSSLIGELSEPKNLRVRIGESEGGLRQWIANAISRICWLLVRAAVFADSEWVVVVPHSAKNM